MHSHLSQHAPGPVLQTGRGGKREGRRGERERRCHRPEGFRSVRTVHHEGIPGTGRQRHGVRSEVGETTLNHLNIILQLMILSKFSLDYI